ncbi:LysR family transcriptional regulator [Telmatospirillum siberiense]|uniref:LysR family transcriptional regulator n=1 Tax=Telmatospirillum siberiense TaxID=382514 RepID=A0A2N3Q1F6_9PROT|nr:LysR family transcriptional regulator [Telmatospirillum siberiense]PKU26488.1 LysR family transcriptional regulator [Telmatospirillum siberiense]
MDRLDSMEAFVRVADSHSFSEAARRLGLSKSVVSRQVSALESQLGARLFHRTTRSLSLTEIGQAYYERCARILAEIEEANLSVSSLQAAPRGKLRINAPMSFGVLHLAPLLPAFLARYPQIDIDMAMNDRFVSLVDEGFDVAVRIGKLEDSSLIARYLAPARRVVCASPAYLEQYGTPLTPNDLDGHCCLTYSNRTTPEEWPFHTLEGQRWAVEVHGRLRVDNGDALREAALGGVGIVTLPSFIVGRDLQAGSLVPLLSEYIPQDLAIHAVYPHNRHLSPKVRAFVDFLVEHIGSRPYWDLVE